MKQEEIQCCVVQCERPLDATYWNNQYESKTIGWDLGQISPPIKTFIDTLQNKNAAILIPGCGNTYEAEYLLQQGFTNITVIDIAPALVENLKNKFAANKNINVVLGDFFEHQGNYDYILEQTFLCAIPPAMRQKYVYKMHQLLNANGKLAGLLFDTSFEQGPPFGGSQAEYEKLFKASFNEVVMLPCKNSIPDRKGKELWIEMQKCNTFTTNILQIEGLTFSECAAEVTEHFMKLEDVYNVSVSTNLKDILLVSIGSPNVDDLQATLTYEPKYKITFKNKIDENIF